MSYGIQIFNANGTSEIFGHNAAGSHFLAAGQVQNLTSGNTSNAISCEGMLTNNTNTVGVTVIGQAFSTPTITRGNGSFTITNNSGSTATFYYYAYRF